MLKLHHLKLAVRLVLGGMNPDKCHYVVMIVKNSARGDSVFLIKMGRSNWMMVPQGRCVRKNLRKCFVKKIALKSFANFTGKHLC